MPTHLLLPYVESPEGPGHDDHTHADASLPEKARGPPLSCMFCPETFPRAEDLRPHLLARHPTTHHAPAVLRVEAEFQGERARPQEAEAGEEPCCAVCGQGVADASALEAHMRRHKDSFTYCCGLCGRRFREPWFLKNHMRTHGGKAGGRGKSQDPEAPPTLNDVPQPRPPSPVPTRYKMCTVCGFFFLDKGVLARHSRVHAREEPRPAPPETPLTQKAFLRALRLHPAEARGRGLSGRWIAQLDPFNTYQAWQLATRGKIAAGHNLAKELNADSDSGDEDSEELGAIWGGAEKTKAGLKCATPSPPPEQKGRKDKPTTCPDCGKIFRTYHQLVLHSRVHKKEGPCTPLETRPHSTSSLEPAEELSEDGWEEGGDERNGEASGKMKLKILAPRKCVYCAKTFRSNYYLNIHLRTHTGEKPYKCEYCDYAAAQKTSLRYHLDRRHKDKPFTDIPNIPATPRGVAKSPEPPELKPLPPATPPLPQELAAKTRPEEEPLDLSLRGPAHPASAPPRGLLPTSACPACSYRTLFPEVLLMHRRLLHPERAEPRRGVTRHRPQRYTGCPPALQGRDVTAPPQTGRQHPRRTRSPVQQPLRDQHRGRGAWPGGAAKPCLSDRFRNLPQRDAGEPSGKRHKAFDDPLGTARMGKGVVAPPTSTPGGSQTDWNVINLLRSRSPAAPPPLYRHAPAGSRSGIFPPRGPSEKSS